MPNLIDSQTSQDELPTHEQIAERAYDLYLQDGNQDGNDLTHWLRAEEELKAQKANRNQPRPLKAKNAGFASD